MKIIWTWWFWLLIALLLLGGTAVGIRASSVKQWERAQAEFRAQGLGTGFADLVARAPAVDQDRQERLWAWMMRVQRMKWAGQPPSAPDPAGAVMPRFKQDAKTAARHAATFADGRSDMEDVGRILDEGPVVISMFGWVGRDFPNPGRADYTNDIVRARIPNLMSSRSAACWWAYAAVGGDLSALDRLDAWVSAFDQPGSIIDAMIAIAVADIRDTAYRHLALAGRLPADRLQHWSDQAPRQLEWGALGFDGERLACLCPLVEHGYGDWRAFSGSGIAFPLCDWLSLHAAASHAARYETGIAQALRTGAAAPAYAPAGLHALIAQYGIMAVMMPNLAECAVTCVQAAQVHRQVRQASMLLHHWRQNGSLPATWNIPCDPRLPPLVYERLSDSRFRLGVDPKGIVPALVPPGRIGDSQTGSPASREPLVDKRWSLELDCAAGWK